MTVRKLTKDVTEKLASGHKGVLMFTLKAHGKAGHSGYPWLGQNANHLLVPALAALQKLELPSSEKYGNSTLNIGLVSGGVAANVIAEEAQASVAIRIAAGSPETVKKLVSEAVMAVDENLELIFNDSSYGPYLPISSIVKTCSKAPWLPLDISNTHSES